MAGAGRKFDSEEKQKTISRFACLCFIFKDRDCAKSKQWSNLWELHNVTKLIYCVITKLCAGSIGVLLNKNGSQFWHEKYTSQVGKYAFISSSAYLKILLCWKKLFLSFAERSYFSFQPHQYLTLFMITLIICVTSKPNNPSHEPRNAWMQNKECSC